MAINKVINSQSQEFQPVLTDTLVLDAVPTVNSFNSVTSDAVARAVAGASGEVPAVTESDNGKVLTAVYDEGGAAVEWADAQGGGAEYSAGTGISISAQDEISVDTTVIATKNDLSSYQPTISDLETIRSGASAGATAVQPTQLATVATTGSYNDLSGKPTIPAAQVNSDWNAASGVSQILNKPSLATVATSGSYADLSNKPTIPTVDQSYSASSTNAQSGTAVAGALATVNQVPASTSADEDKVLTVNSSGTPVWAAAQGGGSSYTAGDGIAISGQNAISAKVGDGLEIGSHAGSAVTANMSAIAYLGGDSNAYLNYVMQLTSDLVNKIETSGISVTLSKVANADWECYYANSNAFPAIVAYTPTVGADSGTRLVLSNTGYSIVDNKLQTGVAYDFNLDDINTSMSNTTWAYIKANPTNYALTFIHSSSFGGYGVVSNLGNNTLSDSTTYTTGSYNYAVVEQGFINVSNPLPASTSSDENKVLTVNSSGAPVWANAQGGGIEAFYITSTTTNNEIYQAYKAGKFLYYQPSTNAEWIPMTMGLNSQTSNWIIYEIQGSYAMTYYASYAAARFNVYSGEIKVAVSTDQADSNAFTTTYKTLTAVNTPIANTSTDVGKVLTITANGPAWVTPS